MKLLPKGKWALVRFGVLFALLVGVVVV
ncbi:MAG: hypothetical protein RIQ79_1553, partial [Verrucomicrobiota bacterium]